MSYIKFGPYDLFNLFARRHTRPWLKKTLSRTAGITLHHLAGIPTHDVTNSFKMYTKRTLESMQIESNGGFELGMEITIKAYHKGMKISQIPTVWKDRSVGKSNFRLWNWLPRYLYWYLFALRRRFVK